MPVLQKRAALGWEITKRTPMGGSREHKMLHTGIEDCWWWWWCTRTGGELVYTDTSVCLITSDTWSRRMTSVLEWTSSSADNTSTHCSGRMSRFVLETACSEFWPRLTSFSFGPAVTWKCNQSSTQLKHHLMCLNSSSWRHKRFKGRTSGHEWLSFNTNKTPS